MKYLNDIEIITSGGRLRGDLGMSLKCFDRFQNVEALSNIEYDLIQIFTGAKKLFMKEYYYQQFFTIHLVMDALNPYSKTSFTQKIQKPDDFNKSFDRLFNFFHSYLGSTISSNRIEKCLVNFNNSSRSERVKSLHAAMEAINEEESNEFIRYMLERKIHEVPETIQEMGEGIYEFWISRRKEYPELSKLALSLLYMKCSTADIERSFSICKSILCHRYSLGSEMLEASILIRLGLDSFGIRPNKNIDKDLEETVFNYVSEHI